MKGLALRVGDVVPFHRIACDEWWTHLDGDTVELHLIHPDGREELCVLAGIARIDKGTLVAARLLPGGRFATCCRMAEGAPAAHRD